jgi:hypothetical protein
MPLHRFFIVLLAAAVLLLLSAAYFTLRKGSHRFDPRHGIATLQGHDYLIRELKLPALTTVSMGSARIHTLVIRHTGREIALMSSTSEGMLDPVHQALSADQRNGTGQRHMTPFPRGFSVATGRTVGGRGLPYSAS